MTSNEWWKYQSELESRSLEEQAAVDLVRYALTLVWIDEFGSRLQRLKTLLELVSLWLDGKEAYIYDEDDDLGLDELQYEEDIWQESCGDKDEDDEEELTEPSDPKESGQPS